MGKVFLTGNGIKNFGQDLQDGQDFFLWNVRWYADTQSYNREIIRTRARGNQEKVSLLS